MSKFFAQKNFLYNNFCLFIFAMVYSAAYIFVYLIKNDYLIKHAKRGSASYGIINIQKLLHIYFCTSFLVYLFCTFN